MGNKELSFEQAMKRLSEITAKIEKNDCSLDESLKLFEEGMALSAICDEKLKSYEGKMNELINKGEEHD